MAKLGLLLAIPLAMTVAGTASASPLHGTPYTFTGSVTSASSACPYAAKAKLAGYTLLAKRYTYSPPNYQPKLAGYSGPELIFSPGSTAQKMTIKLDNLPLRSGAISGHEQILLLPNITQVAGTYKGTMNVGATTLGLTFTSAFKDKGGKECTTTFEISFKSGIPTKFLDLL